jgi:hypothetical protein
MHANMSARAATSGQLIVPSPTITAAGSLGLGFPLTQKPKSHPDAYHKEDQY